MDGAPLAYVVTPNAADAALALSFLGEHGIAAASAGSVHELPEPIHAAAGCLILVEEALLEADVPVLRKGLERQPAWSDLPLVLISRDPAAAAALVARAFPRAGNVTLLERPLNPHTLASAVLVGLRAAARQREVGELIAERERAVRLRDEFLAMLAHELRNPLAPMLNALYLMQRLNVPDARFAASREILERQVNHVARMVDDLMDVARLEHGKVALQKSRLDLNRAVISAVDACRPAAEERGHRVSAQLFEVHPLTVEADPVRLEQIVCNLVNNAVKYTLEPSEIRVETALEGAEALITVRDQGIGFDPASAETLFAPFTQANPTLERTTGGLGIGLTIVRRLAQLHGGSIRAESAGRGAGASFVVRLPLAEDAAEPAQAAADAGPAPRRQRVVVVEDNPDIRETLRQLLTLWGHEVAVAGNGSEGCALLLRELPDVALIDVGLPGMNGYDIARAVRSQNPNGVRLIAITGYGQPSDRELALSAGFDAHLLKPISPETLERVIAGA